MKYSIVLASASPRRKELMKLITDEYRIRPTDADETIPPHIPIDESAEYVARIKAEAAKQSEDEVVIGCDTMVMTPEGEILGKPRSTEDCRRMLRALSGRKHRVCTGVCILHEGKIKCFTVTTQVLFDELSDKDIEDYIDTGEPFDKAGGYGIQGKGSLLVKGIEGDYFNVVGLPVNRLFHELHNMNIL